MTIVLLVGELYRVRIVGREFDVVVDEKKIALDTKAKRTAAAGAAEALASLCERVLDGAELELGIHTPNDEAEVARILRERLGGRFVRKDDAPAAELPADAAD